MKSIRFNKRGISTMIEYVLLIVIVITMSSIVFVWMKTYVPKDDIECQDGVSVYISDLECSSKDGEYYLDIKIKNSGRFNVRGFFIRGSNNQEQEMANIDLSDGLVSGNKLRNEVIFVGIGDTNGLAPTEERAFSFKLESLIYFIDLIPTRLENIEGRDRLALCGSEKISEKISCN